MEEFNRCFKFHLGGIGFDSSNISRSWVNPIHNFWRVSRDISYLYSSQSPTDDVDAWFEQQEFLRLVKHGKEEQITKRRL